MAAVDAVSRFAAGSEAAMAAVLGDAALVESWLELSPKPKVRTAAGSHRPPFVHTTNVGSTAQAV